MSALSDAATSCPLCGGPAFGWLSVPAASERATVGMPSPVHPEGRPDTARARLIDRCQDCGTGIVRGGEVDLAAELRAICAPDGRGGGSIGAPNRASVQAGIGGEGWAALAEWAGRLLLTPRGLELLARSQGLELERLRFSLWGAGQRWMWQTLVNGLTLHPNFAHEARAGRLRPASARSRFAFFADAVATVLAAPLVAALSFPLELAAIVMRRGGLMQARARPIASA